jgi:phage replication-related protein YjqB (UPF0714/DUF867 family)
MSLKDHYPSFAELARSEHEGIDYRRVWEARDSSILILAPHGGGIERGTSEIAQAVAGKTCSWYCFEGLKADGNQDLHVTSARFDEPQALALLAAAHLAVTIHGLQDHFSGVYIGGLAIARRRFLIRSLESAGFPAEADRNPRHAARLPRNLCNRCASGRGLQLEISTGLRQRMFRSLSKHGCRHTTPVFHEFITAIQTGLGLLP